MIIYSDMDGVLADFFGAGSPLDRGSADRYYGRPYDPHYWPMGTYKGIRIDVEQMEPLQIAEYTYGYENETRRKYD